MSTRVECATCEEIDVLFGLTLTPELFDIKPGPGVPQRLLGGVARGVAAEAERLVAVEFEPLERDVA